MCLMTIVMAIITQRYEVFFCIAPRCQLVTCKLEAVILFVMDLQAETCAAILAYMTIALQYQCAFGLPFGALEHFRIRGVDQFHGASFFGDATKTRDMCAAYLHR